MTTPVLDIIEIPINDLLLQFNLPTVPVSFTVVGRVSGSFLIVLNARAPRTGSSRSTRELARYACIDLDHPLPLDSAIATVVQIVTTHSHFCASSMRPKAHRDSAAKHPLPVLVKYHKNIKQEPQLISNAIRVTTTMLKPK